MTIGRTFGKEDSRFADFRELSVESALPLCAAAVVAGCFTWSAFLNAAPDTPLPYTLGAAVFLACIVFHDVRDLRIPNAVTFPALGLALFAVAALEGFEAGLGALAGAGVAFAIGLLPFLLRLLGAGDVKAMMVIGALYGANTFFAMAWWMVVIGGLIALALVAVQPGGLRDLVVRWSKSAWYSLRSARVVYFAPEKGSAAASGLPFAVAIGLGATAFNLWGQIWA